MDAKGAESYLRDIHAIMERSVKHSTLSGLSGIVAGSAAIIGAVVSDFVIQLVPPHGPVWIYAHPSEAFLLVWLGVLLVAASADVVFTKRKARKIGKSFFDHPMRRVIVALIPGFTCGLAITIYFYRTDDVLMLPAYWMLFYGLALVSVSSISLKELFFMGIAFVAAGIFTLFAADGLFPLLMMGVSFGGFHLVYGVYMWLRYGG